MKIVWKTKINYLRFLRIQLVSRLGPEAIQCKIYAQGSSFTTARQNVKNLCERVSEGLN